MAKSVQALTTLPSEEVGEEEAALIFAEATGCGAGSTGPDGKWCRILCDDESLHPTMERHSRCDCRIGARAILSRLSLQSGVGGVVPVDQWKIGAGERVLLYVVHPNAKYEADDARRLSEWEGWFTGCWIKHNNGGWMWHGMSGTVTHVAPLPSTPSHQKKG